MEVPFVDLSRSHGPLERDTLQALESVIKNGQYILGKEVELFEQTWANYCGTSHAVGMSSGLDALQVGLLALGVKPGDEVIMPANGFIATAFAILAIGAIPRFCGVDPSTHCIRLEDIEQVYSSKCNCVIPVHLYGQVVPEIEAIVRWAARNDVKILEDTAQAHGATLHGVKAGAFGEAGIFSFYPTKNLGAAGDAGALISNDIEVINFSKAWRNYGGLARFDHQIIGRNARMDTLQAAILSIRLTMLNDWTTERIRLADYYLEGLKSLETDGMITLPHAVNGHGSHVYHLFVIRVLENNKQHSRDGLKGYLQNLGIGTSIQYPKPIHLQHSMDAYRPSSDHLLATESLSMQILSLPLFPGLTQSEQTYVIEAILAYFKQ
jgi:dTDP-4-amino-4,6-dideoxygalactose transaminase